MKVFTLPNYSLNIFKVFFIVANVRIELTHRFLENRLLTTEVIGYLNKSIKSDIKKPIVAAIKNNQSVLLNLFSNEFSIISNVV